MEGLKDGLQEVPKGDNWPRKHFSFPENICLHLRDISTLKQYTKKAKNPNFQPDPWDPWFPAPPPTLHASMQPFSSLLYK
jgi:hypothetical protein